MKTSNTYPSPQQLSDNLVTITDLPSGWSETQRQVFETRSNENPSIDPSIWCTEAATAAVPLIALAGGSGADVEMDFKKSAGQGVRIMRLQAWSNADAKEYMATVKEVVQMCDGKSRTDDGGATSSTAVITGHTIGDESVSWSETVTPPSSTSKEKFDSVGRTTVVRFENTIMVLQIGDAAPSGTAQLMAEADWWEIVTRAGTKLKRVA